MDDRDLPPQSQPADRHRGLKSLGFLAVLVGVVGVFSYLSSLDPPPNLPKDEVHRFRFNTEGDLVGLATEATADAPLIEHAAGLRYDKKGIEARVNGRCASCHGLPQADTTGHPCAAGPGCLGPNHPPKESCIKCHRHGP
ncbi:MAG: hypothetical protein ACO3JL_11955 [Myxococcota bacterium]